MSVRVRPVAIALMIRSSSRSERSSRGEAKLSAIPSRKRHLPQQPGEQERHDGESARGEKHRLEGGRERLDVRQADASGSRWTIAGFAAAETWIPRGIRSASSVANR